MDIKDFVRSMNEKMAWERRTVNRLSDRQFRSIFKEQKA
jgi:hypothetical protein